MFVLIVSFGEKHEGSDVLAVFADTKPGMLGARTLAKGMRSRRWTWKKTENKADYQVWEGGCDRVVIDRVRVRVK